MSLQKSGEDYLETILVLKRQKGLVRSIDVAHFMEFSKPSVSRAVGNLRRDGLLLMKDDGELVLTEEGLRIAENIYERHTILTSMLTQIGVSEKTAAEDACNMEHVISEETFQKIKEARYEAVATKSVKSKASKADEASDTRKKKKKKKKS